MVTRHALLVEVSAPGGRGAFTAVCSCGWRGPLRPYQPASAADFEAHLRALDDVPGTPGGASPRFELDGPGNRRAGTPTGTPGGTAGDMPPEEGYSP
jgi:hypothetical protein